MTPDLTLALIAATAVLVAIPGPNVALIVANTIAHGFRFGAITVLGTTVGVGLQLVVVVAGLAVVVELAAELFAWIRWIGVGYLLYLGIAAWRRGMSGLAEAATSVRPAGPLFWQGLLLALINPKTLLFSAAFLPQFVAPGPGLGSGMAPGAGALVVPAAVYLGVLLLGDLAWAGLARRARPAMIRLGRLRHKLTGALFVGAGLGLALARVER